MDSEIQNNSFELDSTSNENLNFDNGILIIEFLHDSEITQNKTCKNNNFAIVHDLDKTCDNLNKKN